MNPDSYLYQRLIILHFFYFVNSLRKFLVNIDDIAVPNYGKTVQFSLSSDEYSEITTEFIIISSFGIL